MKSTALNLCKPSKGKRKKYVIEDGLTIYRGACLYSLPLEAQNHTVNNDKLCRNKGFIPGSIKYRVRKFRPGLFDKLRSFFEKSLYEVVAINIKNDFFNNLKGFSSGRDYVWSEIRDFYAQKAKEEVYLPVSIINQGAKILLKSIKNEHYLMALAAYRKWRNSAGSSARKDIIHFVQCQWMKEYNHISSLFNSIDIGTTAMSKSARRTFLAHEDAIVAALMEYSYLCMQELFGDKW